MTQVSVTGDVGPILPLSQPSSPSLHAPQYTRKLAMILTLVQFIFTFHFNLLVFILLFHFAFMTI